MNVLMASFPSNSTGSALDALKTHGAVGLIVQHPRGQNHMSRFNRLRPDIGAETLFTANKEQRNFLNLLGMSLLNRLLPFDTDELKAALDDDTKFLSLLMHLRVVPGYVQDQMGTENAILVFSEERSLVCCLYDIGAKDHYYPFFRHVMERTRERIAEHVRKEVQEA